MVSIRQTTQIIYLIAAADLHSTATGGRDRRVVSAKPPTTTAGNRME
jgi:hypothetical protein